MSSRCRPSTPQGHDVQAIIPTDRAGVELFDDWDGFGQRTTASGGTPIHRRRGRPRRGDDGSDGTHLGHSTTFLQLYLAAVAAGIAAAVLRRRRRLRAPQARPAAHSVADTAGRDPFVLQAVGEIGTAAAAPRRWCSRRPTRIDGLVDQAGTGHRRAGRVAVTVAQAQLVAERLTLDAAQRLFDTGGASATARTLNLDRHWRNARTVASPTRSTTRRYAAGNYPVNASVPPANGYF